MRCLGRSTRAPPAAACGSATRRSPASTATSPSTRWSARAGPWAARLAAAGTIAPGDAALLDRIGRRLAARLEALDAPVQALHGDAHLRNVVRTARGPLWNDFEDTFRGPREWDLACLDAWARVFGNDPGPVAAALAGYGPPGDPDVLELMVDTRAYVGAAWTVLHAPRRPDGAARIADRLRWLRAREAEATR